MSGQFDHGEVSPAQRLVQVVQAGDLSIVMAFEPRHGGCRMGREGAAAYCLPAGLHSLLHLSPDQKKFDEALVGSGCGESETSCRSLRETRER